MKFLSKIFCVMFLSILCPAVAKTQNFNVEIRSAAFFHSSKRFRDVYGDVGCSYQLEASALLNNCWNGWVNFDWFSDHRKLKKCHASTDVSIFNTSVGLKYTHQFCKRYVAYVGIGPSFSRIWLKNKCHCEHEKISKFVIGGLLKTGIYYFFTCDLFLDLFFDYLYQPVHIDRHIDIGGFKTGVGIGKQF